MPGLDQTGPRGLGPGTGRGLGPCLRTEERWVCPECGACACDLCFQDGHCSFCGYPDRIPYIQEEFYASLKKKARDFKSLADALKKVSASPDPRTNLEEAKRASEKIIEYLSDKLEDLRSDVEMGLDQSRFLEKHLGRSYYKADNHIDDAITFYKALVSEIDSEIKNLLVSEVDTKIKELEEQKKNE